MKKLIIFVLAIVLCGSCTSEKSISKKIKFQKEVNFEHSMKLNNSIKNYGLNENNIAINPKLNPEKQESEEKQFIASTNEIVPLYSKNKDGNNLYHIDKSLDTKILNKQIIGNKKKSREPKKIKINFKEFRTSCFILGLYFWISCSFLCFVSLPDYNLAFFLP